MISGLVDLYMSSLSHSMNGVMKTLTVISSIFIPLTFIAGIYGMNFQQMPELSHPNGYPIVMICMGILSIIMLFFLNLNVGFEFFIPQRLISFYRLNVTRIYIKKERAKTALSIPKKDIKTTFKISNQLL